MAGGARLFPDDFGLGVTCLERPAQTERCVNSLLATTPATKVYLADDGSQSQAALELLDRLAGREGVEVLRGGENRGPSAARNAILAHAEGRHRAWFFLDNDVLAFDPRWLEAAAIALSDEYDLVQPLLLGPDRRTVDRGPNRAQSGLSAHPHYLARGLDRSSAEVSERAACSTVGGTFGVRSEVLGAIGGFDPDLRMGEDYDFSLRAASAGFRLGFEPSCVLVHDHGFDPGYEEARSSPLRCLQAHARMIEKHGKALLSPRYFRWYLWLARNGEPMYLERKRRLVELPRRVRRRLVREILFRRSPAEWRQLELARDEIRRVQPLLRTP